MVTIVDSGSGNVASVVNMFRRVGGEARLTSSPDDIRGATKLVLPGIGAFDAGMARLRNAGFDVAIREAVIDNGAALLGICLGMQLLLEGSEEGSLPGLGLVPGRVRRFQVEAQQLRVPHMGWNIVRPTRESTLLDTASEEFRFYFVHSYYVHCECPEDVAGVTEYGHDFTSVLEHGRIAGVQFHPEKSHRFGMTLLKRFMDS